MGVYIGIYIKKSRVFLGPGTYSIGSGPKFHADCRGRYAKPWYMCREIGFPVLDTKTLNLNLFFEIVLLSPRPGNHLNTFLASFTSSQTKSQPKRTNIRPIHAQNVFLGAEYVLRKKRWSARFAAARSRHLQCFQFSGPI